MDLEILSKTFTSGLGDFGTALQQYTGSQAYDANAGLLELDAEQIMLDSEYRQKRMEERGESYIGTQTARYAKAGVTFSGSAMKAIMQSEKNIRMDMITSRNNAIRQSNRKGYEALNQKLAAGRARTRAVMSVGKGVLNMAGTYAIAKS